MFKRPFRVLVLLAIIGVLSLVDLDHTLAAASGKYFHELNGLAANLISQPIGLTAFKVALLVGGMAVLLRFRSRPSVELGCWFLLAAHIFVLVRWQEYFSCIELTLADPATTIEPALALTGR
jgi:hypothetical protein